MRLTRAAVVVFALVGCASSRVVAPTLANETPPECPPPFTSDAPREARIVAMVARDEESRAAVQGLSSACFGPSEALGVLVAGRPMLDARASDGALAGRLVHLGAHLHDGLGDGCRVGLTRALASEERARALETKVRAREGLGPLADDGKATADYAARCRP